MKVRFLLLTNSKHWFSLAMAALSGQHLQWGKKQMRVKGVNMHVVTNAKIASICGTF